MSGSTKSHPRTGASIEAFYADRTLETFGRSPMNDRLLSYPTTNVRALTRLEWLIHHCIAWTGETAGDSKAARQSRSTRSPHRRNPGQLRHAERHRQTPLFKEEIGRRLALPLFRPPHQAQLY